MRIAIEISPQLEGKRGVGVYTENLIRHLALIDRDNEYLIFTWFFRDYEAKLASIYRPPAENFRVLARRLPDSLVSVVEWDLRFPLIERLLKEHRVDVYHSPGPRLPNLSRCGAVTTIHDLINEKFPEWVSERFSGAARRAVERADAVIADSESTRSDIRELYGVPGDKVEVIPLGVDPAVFSPEAAARAPGTAAKYGLPEKFILEVGPFEPRRNTETLLKAYALAREAIRPYKLVLVGSAGAGLRAQAASLGIAGDVIFTGRLATEELAAVYGLSSVFAHLSLYEGFGLSVLEAMACGSVPLISDVSSLPEIGGDACLKVAAPRDPGECAKALTRLVTDGRLRGELRDRAIKRAATFTWENTARKTLECYKRAAR